MKKSVEGHTTNKQDLAAFLGISLPTIDAWMRKGMPCRKRGGSGTGYQFVTPIAIRWRLAHKVAADSRRV